MNRDIAASFLRESGHNVICVDGGAKAIAAVTATDFDVVLMDVRMPKMDGLEATRRIRALQGPRSRVPIVALTAQAFTEQVAECRHAGMDSHLAKPFDPAMLVAAVVQAAAAGPSRGAEVGAALAAVKVAAVVAVPMIGAELPVLDQTAFERTAIFLAPEAVASYLHTITELSEILLRDLREPYAIERLGEKLAEAAHVLAGSAGMLGFKRLSAISRGFERAIRVGAAETPSLAGGLSAVLGDTMQAIRERELMPAAA